LRFLVPWPGSLVLFPCRELKLTLKGKEFALNVIKKHRLWETFLHQTFGLSLHEIHREAELLEHQTSDFLAEKINVFLGFPAKDPHGDPIPGNEKADSQNTASIPMSKAQEDKEYTITRLYSSDKEFFDFCNINKIEVGRKVYVTRQYPNNGMTEIKINNAILLLNKDLSEKIHGKESN
jgi:DtxR family Mn-dependent transcriptional regulator